VLKLNTRFPRLLGDIGNRESFRYPVSYLTIESAIPGNVTVAEHLPESLQQEFLAAALKLIDKNVSIITTTCGFLSTIQEQLAALSHTPVICSSLALQPLLAKVHGGAEHIGVLTFNPDTLNQNHFGSVQPGHIEGLQTTDHLRQVIEQDLTQLDPDTARDEAIAACDRLITSNPITRAIILECTNLSPYKKDIRQHAGVAVYDIVDAVHWMIESQAV